MTERRTRDRLRLILLGALIGVAWAASLRAFMMALAGPDSNFTVGGTFGTIISTGVVVGALLGWAEHQRRTGGQQGALVLAPLVIAIAPTIELGTIDSSPISLALLAMAGGYSVSGRGRRWARIVAGIIGFAIVPVTFLAPKPYPDLSATTAYGAWFATLFSSLFITLALACSIPMRRPVTSGNLEGQADTAESAEGDSSLAGVRLLSES